MNIWLGYDYHIIKDFFECSQIFDCCEEKDPLNSQESSARQPPIELDVEFPDTLLFRPVLHHRSVGALANNKKMYRFFKCYLPEDHKDQTITTSDKEWVSISDYI